MPGHEATASQTAPPDPDELLTPDEAASLAGKSRQTIYNWINRKRNPLSASKPGREWRIRRGDLEAYLLEEAAVASAASTGTIEAADAHVPVQTSTLQHSPADNTKSVLVTGRFQAIKPVPAPAQTDASAEIEMLLDVAEIALKLRRYTYSALAARNVNDSEWAEKLETLVTHFENQLMEAVAPFSATQLADLRALVRTTPIKNIFQQFEVSLKTES